MQSPNRNEKVICKKCRVRNLKNLTLLIARKVFLLGNCIVPSVMISSHFPKKAWINSFLAQGSKTWCHLKK